MAEWRECELSGQAGVKEWNSGDEGCRLCLVNEQEDQYCWPTVAVCAACPVPALIAEHNAWEHMMQCSIKRGDYSKSGTGEAVTIAHQMHRLALAAIAKAKEKANG